MKDAYIIDGIRTPIGSHQGTLSAVRTDDLAALVIAEIVKRNPNIPKEAYDDVILGCANQAGEDNRNVARMASLLAGLPVTVPGQTVNRLCGSGLQAVMSAAQAVRAGEGELFIAGGVESMTRAPYVMLKSGSAWNRTPPPVADTTVGWRFTNPKMPKDWTSALGETAERVAEQYAVSRAEQDAFAVESQARAQAAIAGNAFLDELVPVELPDGKGGTTLFTTDGHPRAGVTLVALGKMKPAFLKDGTVTAGTSSGINDGAAALAVMSEAGLTGTGSRPLARIVAGAVAGVDPSVMGIGPVPAVRKVLARAGLKPGQLDLIELNEAFAAQAIACI